MTDMKECFKYHPVLHSVTGFGLALILANYLSFLTGNTGLWIGVVLLVGGIVLDATRKS